MCLILSRIGLQSAHRQLPTFHGRPYAGTSVAVYAVYNAAVRLHCTVYNDDATIAGAFQCLVSARRTRFSVGSPGPTKAIVTGGHGPTRNPIAMVSTAPFCELSAPNPSPLPRRHAPRKRAADVVFTQAAEG